MFTAVKGEGAYLNQKPIHVSGIDRLATSLLCTGFPSAKRSHSPNIHYYWDFTMRSHGVRRDGSAALDLAAVACGRFDGFWEFGLHPWDTAAGALLVREAGGTVTTFSGQPYRPGDRETLASNGHIHEEMRQIALDIGERAAQAPRLALRCSQFAQPGDNLNVARRLRPRLTSAPRGVLGSALGSLSSRSGTPRFRAVAVQFGFSQSNRMGSLPTFPMIENPVWAAVSQRWADSRAPPGD